MSQVPKRILRDLLKFKGEAKIKDKEQDVYAYVRQHVKIEPLESDGKTWDVLLKAPAGSAYDGAVYKMKIRFDDSYPFKGPVISFVDQCLHPNVELASGEPCQDAIGSGANWNPVMSATLLLRNVLSIFETPNTESPVNVELMQLYQNNLPKFKAAIAKHIKTLKNSF